MHDLHDDAIDLRQAAYEAVKDMRKNYDVHIEYDMSAHIPRNVKYCFIAIVKEGMSNIIKHSNADKVDIIFREHPGFYQLCIEDNGSVSHSVEESDHGIGISNMRERLRHWGEHSISDRRTDFGFLQRCAKRWRRQNEDSNCRR